MTVRARTILVLLGLLAVPPGLSAQALKERDVLKGQPERIDGMAFSPDGKLLAVGGPGYAALWDLAVEKKQTLQEGQNSGVTCAAFSPDGKILAMGGSERTVLVWDVAAGKRRMTLPWDVFRV